ncbi:MAG: hypothetical protein ACRCSF_00605 [Mycobacteriaceae bacterium]
MAPEKQATTSADLNKVAKSPQAEFEKNLDAQDLETEKAPEGSSMSRLHQKIPKVPWLPLSLGLLTVLFTAFAITAWFKPGTDVSNTAYVDGARTEEVKAAAESAVQTLYGLNYNTVGEQLESALQVLTPKMQDELKKSIPTTITAYQQAKMVVDVKALSVGLVSLEGDKAELQLVILVSGTNDGVAAPDNRGKVEMTMVRFDGKWRIDELVG